MNLSSAEGRVMGGGRDEARLGMESSSPAGSVLCSHDCFSPQLWFVYFDLETCVQFLSDHIREMKMRQEVSKIP